MGGVEFSTVEEDVRVEFSTAGEDGELSFPLLRRMWGLSFPPLGRGTVSRVFPGSEVLLAVVGSK